MGGARSNTYIFEGYECEWFEESPFCGISSANIGNIDNKGRTYVSSTEVFTISNLCEQFNSYLYGECCDTYGEPCWSGYK